MKLLLDENVADSTTELCRHLALDVESVKAEGWAGKDDKELIELAIAEGRVVLSFDKDFGNLVRFPLTTYCGVIVIEMRDQRPQRVNERLREVLPTLTRQNLQGKVARPDVRKGVGLPGSGLGPRPSRWSGRATQLAKSKRTHD